MITASPLDAAEQSVLGAMLLSRQAITDVAEILSSDDFSRPAHQAIFDCILEQRGDLTMVGAPYLHTLISIVPTVPNVGYYAEIVAANAVLRRGQSE